MTCEFCSAEVPGDARFCPSCGQPLHVPTDERRVVTVLFGDIVGFTALSETRDPEHVKNLVDRSFARLAADIRTYGGSLDKIVGDAVVALFGAPVAHEDDAERAVRAALHMQQTLADMRQDVDVELKMRIGINTGEVLVGALRAGGDYTAMGDVVNTASRLQVLAEPGTVVVGPDTHAATANVFRYEPLGELHARGREAGVEAWVAREALAQPGRRAPRRVSKLVGRDAEAGLLQNALVGAFRHRRPTLVLLTGEAGIGKSRLAEDVVLRVVVSDRARVLSGRAVPYGATNAWWPIAEVMRAACEITPDDGPDQAREKCIDTVRRVVDGDESERVAEAILFLIGVGTPMGDVESKRARDEVARGVRTFIEALANRQPLVITIADVQWADPSVLAGLDDMLARLHRVPLVLLLTARPEFTGWDPKLGHQNLVVLNLDPLGPEAAGDLLVSLLGFDPGERARAELVERSGGNPLFVEELAAVLVEGGEDVDAGRRQALPATLRGIIAARLDALPSAERAVLDDAAVVGRRAPINALLALGGSRGGVSESIQRLVGEDLLVVDGGLCEFQSDLVREVVYGMLTKAERARRHALHARWLEEQAEGVTASDELLGELGRHWSTAATLTDELGGVDGVPLDVRQQAIGALERAGQRADEREMHAVAARLYDQLLKLIGTEKSATRRHALIGRAAASCALRRDEAAAADLETAEAEALEAGDDVALARALTVRGDVLRNAGEYEQSLAALTHARVIWQRVGDRRGEGSALRRIGWTRLFAGDLDGAEPVLLEALDAFREADALRGQAWAHQNLAWIAYGRGDHELAETRLADSIELFRKIGDWGGLIWATGMLGWARYGQGLVDEAETHAQQAMVEARDQGDLWQVGMMNVLLASIRVWQGRTEDAVTHGREAWRTFAGLDDEWGELQAVGPLSLALMLSGDFEEAERLRADIQSRAQAHPGMENYHRYSVGITAMLSVGMGEPQKALDALADDDTVPGDRRYGSNDTLMTRGLALLQLGRIDEAVDLLTTTVASMSQPGPRSQTSAALSLALAADGQIDRARSVATSVIDGDGSYIDRVMALIALAGGSVQAGEGAAAIDALDRATRLVAGTQDRLSDAMVALARARVLEALEQPFAGGAEVEAQDRLMAIRIEARGWDNVIRRAVTGAGEAPGAMSARARRDRPRGRSGQARHPPRR
jgi:class 3 adenylate cyclase/tetratricopeptide (TPR) repeat protein